MQLNVFLIVSFLITGGSVLWGTFAILKKKQPLYFRLFVYAAGCFLLLLVSHMVSIWCGIIPTMSIGAFGIFGANFFLLSANYGTMDKIVDDGCCSKKARRIAWIAPLVIAVLATIEYFVWKKEDVFTAGMWVVISIPAMGASYFNLKHLLLPTDALGLLKATRPCNISALCYYIVGSSYVIVSAVSGKLVSGTHMLLVALSVFGLIASAVKGSKKWEI